MTINNGIRKAGKSSAAVKGINWCDVFWKKYDLVRVLPVYSGRRWAGKQLLTD